MVVGRTSHISIDNEYISLAFLGCGGPLIPNLPGSNSSGAIYRTVPPPFEILDVELTVFNS